MRAGYLGLPLLSRLLGSSAGERDGVHPGPIRGELLGSEHLAERARQVAASQRIAPSRPRRFLQAPRPLLTRLQGTRRILASTHARLGAAAESGADVGPAGEWLLDNNYVVQEHLREVHESLPPGYYRELPELAGGHLTGYPRVYEVATTLISHTEARVDLDNLGLVVEAFQSVTPLRIGELWALPAMLSLALLESIRRMALRTVERLDQVVEAHRWAARIQAASGGHASALGAALADFMAHPPALTADFVSVLLQQIRPVRGAFPPLVWLEQWIAEEALSAEEAAARSAERLAVTQVITSNSVTSLRAISRMDWPAFVERQSRLERILREDPSGFYPRMTFETRDTYRHVVERLAKRTRLEEEAVARSAVELARAPEPPVAAGEDARRAHVGYYLVDTGRERLERATGFRRTLPEAVRRWVLRHPDFVLVGGIAAGTALVLGVALLLVGRDARTAWLAALLFALLPAADVAVSAMNQLIAALLPPNKLPKLDLRGAGGVPAEFRTAVVIPTLFGSVAAVQEALENLEAQFLANRGSHVHFALLSDFTDAATETRPDDDAILDAAVAGVRALSARYAAHDRDAFFLFHRPRRWNAAEGVWMGWERKRGKLGDFNRLIRGADAGAFSVMIGDLKPLLGVRYVITLDADTVLPPDAAPLLVGAMAHPLNRPIYDPVRGRVVRGYGILQPRVGVSLPSAHRSRFATIFSGHPGVDPYTTAVSDVYQDLYREGSFTGKGIYDVDAFEGATLGRFPENTLLSHDLIEGGYARAGLATDITVYDDYPSRYLTYTRRKQRWIRGDWQLLGWLGPRVATAAGRERNRLSLLSGWKIFDNLRRSTLEVAQLALLVAGWILLPGSPIRWALVALAAISAPWIMALLLSVLRPPLNRSWRPYYAAVRGDALTSAQQLGLTIVFLPHQAWISASGVARTLWRLAVTRRHLLEWQTASVAERSRPDAGSETWRQMAPAVALTAGLALLVAGLELVRRTAGGAPDGGHHLLQLAIAAGPFLSLWLVAPAIADWLSAPALRPATRLPRSGRPQAMRYALLHWRFFDRFVGEESQWLAPDNFQEQPAPALALRTSPTNIGLQLLATVSACDLGFITRAEMVYRLELAFTSLRRMRRLHGHFYNWYDLRDLHVLEPAYISTVDSGNLAGHLIALRQACLALAQAPLPDRKPWPAVEAALTIAEERLTALLEDRSERSSLSSAARSAVDRARALVRSTRAAAAAPLRAGASNTGVVSDLETALAMLAEAAMPAEASEALSEWVGWSVLRLREQEAMPADPLSGRLDQLAERAYRMALGMDFGFLYDRARRLFSIGYDANAHALDPSFYDLLASEARLASFVAIAGNDVPVEHWFRLGRSLTHAAGATALVSWSGSMFEYLMPSLVMRTFPGTLLDQTYRGVVRRQMAYGAARGVPWGVSESAYNLQDRHFTYQYRAFGVPDLGLQRGLGHDVVIAPYASALAVGIEPTASLANLALLARAGALGPFGFRDALDYTRPGPGRDHAVIGSYMAHHIGMSLVALTNALTGDVWQARFHADPLVRSAELLLYERIPRLLVLQEPQVARPQEGRPDPELGERAVREFQAVDLPRPHVALLGYLPYTVLLSHCGSGSSTFEELAVTRWTRDGTTDETGQFCYVKDIATGRTWSAAHQPVCAPSDRYRARLATDHVSFERVDGLIETRMEVAVVPEDAAEVRRVTVTNSGDETRDVEVTSYGELVIGSRDDDDAHPAFSKLFVETEWHEWCQAVSAIRRPRSPREPPVWCMHVLATGKERIGSVTCETDRARFLGRGRTVRQPIALEVDGPLGGTTGAVLDPIFSLRARLRLGPGQSATAAFTTLIATSRERAFELADRYRQPHAARRALDLAWTSTQIELRELNVSSADAAVFQELAGHLLYPGRSMRAPLSQLERNRGSQPLLWQTGISGDLPILLATIETGDGLPTLRELFAAHHFWRRHGMKIDLVVLNAHAASYFQELNDEILAAHSAASGSGVTDVPGGVFVRRRDLLSAETLLMLEATAAVHIECDGRELGRIVDALHAQVDQTGGVDGTGKPILKVSAPAPTRRHTAATDPEPEAPTAGAAEPLAFDNGYGGMTADGDYVVRVRGDELPPMPWSNVVANPHGGFLVTERGGGFTWAGNSYAYRLTPWRNDPVSDPPGEALYLRDEDTGEVWSATPAPAGADAPYRVRHGAGHSSFEHERDGITTTLTLAMAEEQAVRISVVRLTNRESRPRRISLTAYAEWTLGTLRKRARHHVRSWVDAEHAAIFAQNRFDPQFADWVAFCALSEPLAAHTGDRREFLGRNGSTRDPAGLRRPLAGTTGAALDPCAALQCVLELAPGATRDVVVLLGAAPDERRAREAVADLCDVERAADAVGRSVARWRERLTTIAVHTPEPSFDAMVNRWALYQALSARMWGRTGLYQNSGAYGFRDQLQDVMAFVHAEPGVAREHILRAAARQFVEGDVQHWWHPESGRGVRTRFSDDMAWLPYVVEHYVRLTGDATVLDESVAFLHMRPLGPDEPEAYDLPVVSDAASLYEHCTRALRRACTAGGHGLPLIGTGDWNDGMNRVGAAGRGESVWLGWFLSATLRSFAGVAETRGDLATAAWCRKQADAYATAVEAHGWDGEWYRRAYFDDGAPLGSAADEECRIDAIAQSWSVLSGAGDAARQVQAMAALDRELVLETEGIIQLLAPPFDVGPRDPGYIKGYPPGVRENGAQYTHAALWAVAANARLGRGDRAFELFQMLNPLQHALTREQVQTYRVEPYVVAADVYTAPALLGRGGWTWYTGSASWMYRVALEEILGFTRRADRLAIRPRVPAAWPEFTIEYRFGTSLYSIRVLSPGSLDDTPGQVSLDGKDLPDEWIQLVDDGHRHDVQVCNRSGPGVA